MSVLKFSFKIHFCFTKLQYLVCSLYAAMDRWMNFTFIEDNTKNLIPLEMVEGGLHLLLSWKMLGVLLLPYTMHILSRCVSLSTSILFSTFILYTKGSFLLAVKACWLLHIWGNMRVGPLILLPIWVSFISFMFFSYSETTVAVSMKTQVLGICLKIDLMHLLPLT